MIKHLYHPQEHKERAKGLAKEHLHTNSHAKKDNRANTHLKRKIRTKIFPSRTKEPPKAKSIRTISFRRNPPKPLLTILKHNSIAKVGLLIHESP